MMNKKKIKFSVGYPCYTPISFYDNIFPYLDSIGEVYFGWSNFSTGRATFEKDPRYNQELLISDLKKFNKKGIALNLLLNGNCYGARAISVSLKDEVIDIIKEVTEFVSINSVTVASPYLAHIVKTNFPDIDVRASVNMWIDGVGGMSQCKDIFDSFYVKRDYNYCINEIKEEKLWCEENGKRLYLLANSGCLPNCSYHTFHDNMVSHSKDLEKQIKDNDFEPFVCRKIISLEENRYMLLSGNLIRPEDVCNYAGLVDGVKLATRIHPYPSILIRSYVKGEWDGNLTELTEPGFADLLGPYKLKNSALPKDFWISKTNCKRAYNRGVTHYCKDCGYCSNAYNKILYR